MQSWFQRGRADGQVLGRDRCRGQSWFQRGRADGQVLGRDRRRERKSQVLGRAGSSLITSLRTVGKERLMSEAHTVRRDSSSGEGI